MRSPALAIVLMLAACGAPGSSSDASVDAYPWQPGIMLPGPRLEPGLTALGQQLVMLGGFSGGLEDDLPITSEVDVLDTLTNTWTQLPDAPVQWTHVQLFGVDGTLYLLGGESGSAYVAQGSAFALDPGATTWRALSPLPAGLERGAAGLVSAPPHLYLLGGAGTQDALASCLDYDLLTDTWTQLPDLPAPRSHPAAMRRGDGTLIVFGGLSTLDASEPLADAVALPLGADTWTPMGAAPLPTPRGGCAYGIVQGQFICAGGESGVAALHVADSYDPNTDQWTALPDLPAARAGIQGVAIGERLYIPGGANQLVYEPLATMDVFTPFGP
jgi:N-acetylneuraminic acid mutarotase